MSYETEMYAEAMELLKKGDWETAVDILDELGKYRSASEICAKFGDTERAAAYAKLADGEA